MDKYILLYLLTGTKGGLSRIKILEVLKNNPINANKIKEKVGMDYKTVQHHLRILEKHRFVSKSKQKYGSIYYLTDEFKSKKIEFDEILAKVNKQNKRGKNI